jgi:hypothetical protein
MKTIERTEIYSAPADIVSFASDGGTGGFCFEKSLIWLESEIIIHSVFENLLHLGSGN